ncbi:MAG: glycerol-3-phosphate 1-O-acyltransferase PlsY [Actinobacteria bacterium]|nr:glycerol-3-phosphate 1-O-acyltransferase PlsY [Actinomycetota bacterium]
MDISFFQFILYSFLCYFIGSLPFGYMLGRLKGKDITREGSGNIGATNVARTLGLSFGVLVLFLDAFKGYISVLAANLFVDASIKGGFFQPTYFHFVGAFFSVLGHSYSPFLRFSGGKGVATSFGAAFALFPVPTLLGLLTFVFIALLTRVISIASLCASTLVAFCVLVLYSDNISAQIFVLITVILIFYRHRINIEKIFNGNENIFNFGGRR